MGPIEKGHNILRHLLRYCFFVLKFFVPEIKKRWEFEGKNKYEASSQSFYAEGVRADYVFEVASEGELEQVRVLMDDYLQNQKKIEIIFCSPSVEHRCYEIFKAYPEQVRLLRLPLIRFSLKERAYNVFDWVSSDFFIMCRYDFFPELLLLGRQKRFHFVLVWASLKNTKFTPFKLWPLKGIYQQFDQVIAATVRDKTLLQSRLEIEDQRVECFDFRPLQISRRLAQKERSFMQRIPAFHSFTKLIEQYPKDKRIILGSFWDYEASCFSDPMFSHFVESGNLVVVVPHQLNVNKLDALKNSIRKNTQIPIYSFDDTVDNEKMLAIQTQMQVRPGIVIMELKGILCELYTFFSSAYVGGGYGESVHSLLEPYVAGCQVICGPKVHRSTEYDYILEKSPKALLINHDQQQLFSFIREKGQVDYEDNGLDLEAIKNQYAELKHWLKD